MDCGWFGLHTVRASRSLHAVIPHLRFGPRRLKRTAVLICPVNGFRTVAPVRFRWLCLLRGCGLCGLRRSRLPCRFTRFYGCYLAFYLPDAQFGRTLVWTLLQLLRFTPVTHTPSPITGYHTARLLHGYRYLDSVAYRFATHVTGSGTYVWLRTRAHALLRFVGYTRGCYPRLRSYLFSVASSLTGWITLQLLHFTRCYTHRYYRLLVVILQLG